MPATPSLIAERIQHVAESSNIQQLDVCYGGAADQIGVQYSAKTSSASSETDASAGNRRYLIASITKPIVAMAALMLAAEGEFSLVDRIDSLLPMFRKAAFRRIKVRHLLTHTSGFPDMLPANTELRAAHAP
ncbi:serine hydrolase domain-containing protein [Fuerstiella marisgermanici]|uniref:Penicillin-binding protein E n=1 Tax=Fuerstiella marisgermanici TaxID=1891926 RepID=A0A1P8WIR7_9PLAN|nr:serine hydrolase domain-containing protein [Fuerstiella marisgermanici]APZ93941.1 Penicillin-binding protein E [Fuerstiella marisgermanici]